MYARPASPDRGHICARSGGRELVQPSVLRGRERLGVAAQQLAVYEHLREAHHAGAAHELHSSLGVLGEIDFREVQPARFENALHARAEGARISRIDGDLAHYFIKYSSDSNYLNVPSYRTPVQDEAERSAISICRRRA